MAGSTSARLKCKSRYLHLRPLRPQLRARRRQQLRQQLQGRHRHRGLSQVRGLVPRHRRARRLTWVRVLALIEELTRLGTYSDLANVVATGLWPVTLMLLLDKRRPTGPWLQRPALNVTNLVLGERAANSV